MKLLILVVLDSYTFCSIRMFSQTPMSESFLAHKATYQTVSNSDAIGTYQKDEVCDSFLFQCQFVLHYEFRLFYIFNAATAV